ncbi:hypothetical protein [Aureispira anguillae]|uniref:Yip1 domain-containing protein n=1 Tax=Aureispira anguillae TaxID=2864201 RepID=A0A915YC12_9BACT|nr:hypothetical protein [Aureispira anguillae]BDS10305.1 hypothetical protein AsAng_0010130 [Aureispira anguillae]
MNDPLDEQLHNPPKSATPSIALPIKGIIQYLLFFLIFLVVYAGIGETFGNLPIGEQKVISIDFRTIFLAGGITLLAVIPNHFLQKQLYLFYQGSIGKTTLTPLLLWCLIIIPYYLFCLWGTILKLTLEKIFLIIFTWGALFSWYVAGCLLISLYFQHQQKLLYASTLFIYWLVTTLLFHFIII